MRQLTFHRSFICALSACRAAVYVWFGVLGALSAVVNSRPSLSVVTLILPLVVLFLAAVGIHAAFGSTRPLWLLLGVHVLECAMLTMLALLWPLSESGLMWLALIALAANTALWGWCWLPLFCAVPVLTAVLFPQGASVVEWQAWRGFGFSLSTMLAATSLPRLWMDLWAAAGGSIFLLVICGVAHTRAQQLIDLGLHYREQKQRLLRYLPRDLPRHLRGATTTRARREWMTVVFIDLTGFTRAMQELPPEVLNAVLNDFLLHVTTHVENWGGDVSKFLGDGVLCVFPAQQPAQRANMALQALRCVNQLPVLLAGLNGQWRAAGYGCEYGATCGLASGYCCVGDWGGRQRLDYTVIGNPVNLAHRLQHLAGKDVSGRNAAGRSVHDEPVSAAVMDETTRRLIAPGELTGIEIQCNVKGVGSVTAYRLTLSASGQSCAVRPIPRVEFEHQLC